VGVVIEDDVLSHGIALVISTINTKLASPVSRREALYAELASLARKSINTPVRLVDPGTG
jgi:hypothetical protein